MSIFTLIPTLNEPMSIYTLIGFAILIAGNILAFRAIIRWTIREFKRIDGVLGSHDEYMDDNAKIINQMIC